MTAMTAPEPKERISTEHAAPLDGRRPLRVALADPNQNTRRAIATIVDDIDGVDLVVQLDTLTKVSEDAIDVLVVDDRLLARETPASDRGTLGWPGVRVIALGMDESPAFAARARRLGAVAWLAKHTADESLRELLAGDARDR
jgi:hypothetical protein